jgi:hypothetical protein
MLKGGGGTPGDGSNGGSGGSSLDQLLSTSRSAIERFLIDDAAAGTAGLPSARATEAAFVLKVCDVT